MQKVVITGHDLTVDQIIAVCREGAEVVLSDESREKILASSTRTGFSARKPYPG